MTLFFLVAFQALPTKHGHFLWPKHRTTGSGFCVFQLHQDQKHISNAQENEKTIILSTLWAAFLDNHYYELCDPLGVIELAPDNVPMDIPGREEVLLAISKLQKTGGDWYLFLHPPPNMSEEERSFYQKHDVKNASN